MFNLASEIFHDLAWILLTSWNLNVCSVKSILGRKGTFSTLIDEPINWSNHEGNLGLDVLSVAGCVSEPCCLMKVVNMIFLFEPKVNWKRFNMKSNILAFLFVIK